MNERIKKLAEEAGLGQERWNSTEQFNAFLEEFAELIVEECIDIVAAGGEFASRPKLVEQLQRHFGVE